jgi:Domain of unknown function (DUF4249)
MLTFRCLGVLAAGAAAVSACVNLEAPAPPTPPQLVVHAVLDTRADQQFLLLNRARTGAPSSTGSNSHDQPIGGATVTVMAPDGIVMTANENAPDSTVFPAGIYAFTPRRYGVTLAAGGTYTLHIRAQSGEEASGTTTIPVVPASSTRVPSEIFFRLRDTLRLGWPHVPGARSYELVVSPFVSGQYRTFFDTTIAVPGTALTVTGDPIFLPRSTMDIAVSAVDENYYDYYRGQSDPFASGTPTHLKGAVGVFGSIAPLLLTTVRVR